LVKRLELFLEDHGSHSGFLDSAQSNVRSYPLDTQLQRHNTPPVAILYRWKETLMITIQQLLNRIRWDPSFAKGEFLIGYYDRVERRINKAPLNQVYLTPGDHFFFHVAGTDGAIREVPFHRVKEVYKDGKLIWHREH